MAGGFVVLLSACGALGLGKRPAPPAEPAAPSAPKSEQLAAGDVIVEANGGRITLVAREAPQKEVLARLAKALDVKVVNPPNQAKPDEEPPPEPKLTLDLVDVSTRTAVESAAAGMPFWVGYAKAEGSDRYRLSELVLGEKGMIVAGRRVFIQRIREALKKRRAAEQAERAKSGKESKPEEQTSDQQKAGSPDTGDSNAIVETPK